MVSPRRRCSDYLKRTDEGRYKSIIEKSAFAVEYFFARGILPRRLWAGRFARYCVDGSFRREDAECSWQRPAGGSNRMADR